MPGTFTKIYIQLIFAVKGRQNLINNTWKTEFHRYIAGIIKGKNHESIIVNGMPDHIDAFVGLKPAMSISDLVRDIKNNSSNFVNDHKLIQGKFAWQEGYGAFSYGHSQLDKTISYIRNQEKHHRRRTFKDEYLAWLKKFEVTFDERYVFKFID